MEKRIEEITVKASTHFAIWVTCPHCDADQQRMEDLREHLDRNSLRAEECDAELTCETCEQIFYVDEIQY